VSTGLSSFSFGVSAFIVVVRTACWCPWFVGLFGVEFVGLFTVTVCPLVP
jgi:hypothetical protein